MKRFLVIAFMSICILTVGGCYGNNTEIKNSGVMFQRIWQKEEEDFSLKRMLLHWKKFVF